MSDALVSILVPTYNGERFLRPALRSALDQSYRTIEVIVGDDASSDRTPEILASFAAADPRVRVVRHARNAGAWGNPALLLAEARGEYVKFLMHDDVLATDCVRELVRGMESSSDVSLAFSRRALVDENGRQIPGREFAPLRDRPGTIDGWELGTAALESCQNMIGELTTVLFRRADVDPAQLLKIDGRRLEVLGDLGEHLKLLTRGAAFYTPRVLSRFRIHSTQNSWDPAFIARGLRDWPWLIDWGVRQGFLADAEKQRQAYARALQMAAVRVGQLVTGPDFGPALEAVFLATARLLELGTRLPADLTAGLSRRAHDRSFLERFAQELDVWTREYPVALAAPALEAGEVSAAVQALRDVHDAGVAKQLLIAVPEERVEDAVPMVESALRSGPDVDIELVPTDDPARLLTGPWLAVAPHGSTWHEGRATAAWTPVQG